MIDQMQLSSNSVSDSQEIEIDIKKALNLINAVQDACNKTLKKLVNNLLIEYILANMRGDSTEAKAIQDQIEKIIQTYGEQNQHVNGIVAKLKTMSPNPSNLTYLQSLIGALQQDILSGDMSNLSQL